MEDDSWSSEGSAVRWRCDSHDGGQTVVELVLVFPLLLVFVMAIIQIGLAYNAQIVLHYAAFNAVRSYVVYQDRGRAETAARIICLPISARPVKMIEGLLDDLGADLPDFDLLGSFGDVLGDVGGIAERYLYSSHATQVRILDSTGTPVDDGRILEPGKDDVTVEVTHNFRLSIPLVNRLMGKSMVVGTLGELFDFGLYYLPLTAAMTLPVEDGPASPGEGPCFGNVSLGCCFRRDEVVFVQCRGEDACSSPECCLERSRRAWRVRAEVAERKGLVQKGTIVREMTCQPTT